VPDWSRDLGDVVTLSHPRTGLDVKALVVKIGRDGEPGRVSERLDLVILPPTWTDFDAANAARTWDTWDAAWTGKTWNDFDRDPLD